MDRKVHPVAVVAVIILMTLLVFGAPVFLYFRTSPSYNDGREWGLQSINTAPTLLVPVFPGCDRQFMVERGPISGPGDFSAYDEIVFGDDKSHDDYAQWRAGCESANPERMMAPSRG